MEKNKSETDETVRMRAELKKLIRDEGACARNAQKKRTNALNAKHAAASAQIHDSRWSNAPSLFSKLLLKNLSAKKSRAEKAEIQSREAEEALKNLHELKGTLVIRLADAMGIEPPASISEQDVEKYLIKKKLLIQSSSRELEEAEAALKEVTKQDFKKEMRLMDYVQKKKALAERAALNYRNELQEIIRKKENELLMPLLLEPEAKGIDKLILLVKTIFEMMQSEFLEKDVTEIPVYDTSRYGEIVSFVPPKDFDVIEQAWISKPSALINILYNKASRKKVYYVLEPALNSTEKALLSRVNESLKVFLNEQDIDFNRMSKELILYNNFIKILNVYGMAQS